MTKLLIDSDTLTDIADAIRDKEESSNPIQVSNMAYRIEHIQTGGIPVTSVTIDNKSAFQNNAALPWIYFFFYIITHFFAICNMFFKICKIKPPCSS